MKYSCVWIYIILAIILIPLKSKAQSTKGINFQAIARSNNGVIIPNKSLNIRLSIKADTNSTKNEYQEIVPVITNALGLFTIVVGAVENNKTITVGPFENINWSKVEKYLLVEVDTLGDFSFVNMGTQKINYVPFSFYADNVGAQNINGIIGLSQGGTGVDNLKSLKEFLAIDKINNTPDSIKPLTILATTALNTKLNSADTLSLSNRIKLIGKDDYGSFYDTASQPALVATATALKFSFASFSNNISITNNTALAATKITVLHAGIYNIHYAIQLLKNDVGSDIASVWIRRNGSAYLNTNVNYNVTGSGIKNMCTASYYVELGTNDYVELYYSVKNSNTIPTGNLTQSTPSRPATPSVLLTINRVY
jgi:hypothetical protein